mgnify:CR=1 FL=1
MDDCPTQKVAELTLIEGSAVTETLAVKGVEHPRDSPKTV